MDYQGFTAGALYSNSESVWIEKDKSFLPAVKDLQATFTDVGWSALTDY